MIIQKMVVALNFLTFNVFKMRVICCIIRITLYVNVLFQCIYLYTILTKYIQAQVCLFQCIFIYMLYNIYKNTEYNVNCSH